MIKIKAIASELKAGNLFDTAEKLKSQILKSNNNIGIYKKQRCINLINAYYCARIPLPSFATLKQLSRAEINRLIKMVKGKKKQ